MNAIAGINYKRVLLVDQRNYLGLCLDYWFYFTIFFVSDADRVTFGCPAVPYPVVNFTALLVVPPRPTAAVRAAGQWPLTVRAPYCLTPGPNEGEQLLSITACQTDATLLFFLPDHPSATVQIGQIRVNNECLAIWSGAQANGAMVREARCYPENEIPSHSVYSKAIFNCWNNAWEWLPARQQFRNPYVFKIERERAIGYK
jgi:hypothetical protein